MPCGFGGSAEFDVSSSHIFPWVVLAAINLLGSGAGDGGARAKARCELSLLLCLVVNSTLFRVVSGTLLLGAGSP